MTPKNLLSFRSGRLVALLVMGAIGIWFRNDSGRGFLMPYLALAFGIWQLSLLLRGKTTVDEGGLRIDGILGIGRRYRAFSEMRSVLTPGNSRLVAVDARGNWLEQWDVENANVCGEVYLALSERLDARHPVEAPVLERCERGLSAWLEGIATAVHGWDASGPYRGESMGLDQVAALARDIDVPNDIRAGAIFALLCSRDERAQRIAKDLVTEAAPPIVTTVASLAPHGRQFRELARRVAGYLPRADRRVFTELSVRADSSPQNANP